MVSHMSMADLTRRARFSIRADKAFDKALAQARTVFQKIKLSNLVEG